MNSQPIVAIGFVGGERVHVLDGNGISHFEAFEKPGMQAPIPYIRSMCGARVIAEYCQHHLLYVAYGPHEKCPVCGDGDNMHPSQGQIMVCQRCGLSRAAP